MIAMEITDEMIERLKIVKRQSRKGTAFVIGMFMIITTLATAAVIAWIYIIKTWQVVRLLNG